MTNAMNGLPTIFSTWLSRRSMRQIYLAITLFSLMTGFTIIFLLASIPFIRGFLSDVIVVFFLFFLVKTFIPTIKSKPLAIFVLLFSFMAEGLQYIRIADTLQATGILRVVLGATFDWLDLLAYCMGVLTSYVLDLKMATRTSRNNHQEH